MSYRTFLCIALFVLALPASAAAQEIPKTDTPQNNCGPVGWVTLPSGKIVCAKPQPASETEYPSTVPGNQPPEPGEVIRSVPPENLQPPTGGISPPAKPGTCPDDWGDECVTVSEPVNGVARFLIIWLIVYTSVLVLQLMAMLRRDG